MKMRRTLLAFATLLFGFALLSAFPQHAQAAVNCQQTYPTRNYWPFNVYSNYCDGTTLAHGQTVANAINTFTHGYAQDEFRVVETKVYLFHSPADYTSSASALGLGTPATVPSRSFGVVKYDADNKPLHVAIFEVNSANEVNTNFNNSTGVAITRANDRLLGYIMNGGLMVRPLPQASADTQLDAQLNQDWGVFNGKAACGPSGVFTGLADESSTMGATPVYHYICSGSTGNGTTLAPTYVGLANNRAVLQAAWPGAWLNKADIFAHAYAQTYFTGDYNGSPYRTAEFYFTGDFKCTKFFIKSIADSGRLPTTPVSTGCPIPPKVTNCLKFFSGDFKWPGDGFLFKCDSSFAIQNLPGYLNDISVSTQTTLRNAWTYTYVWADDTQYQSTYIQAGFTAPDAFGASDAAFTYPWHNILWVNVDSQPAAFTSPIPWSPLVELIDHEYGHAMDYSLNWLFQSGSGTGVSGFERALQNDFLNLNYVWNPATSVYDARKPCETTAYVGPFVGILDPTTADAAHPNGLSYFCSGGNLVDPVKWGGKLNSQILQDTRITGSYWFHRQGSHSTGDKTYPGGWEEWYAQAFRNRAYADTGGSGAAPVPDGVWSNGYFPCTAGANGWLAKVYAGQPSSPPNLPLACTQALPAGYVPIQ